MDLHIEGETGELPVVYYVQVPGYDHLDAFFVVQQYVEHSTL